MKTLLMGLSILTPAYLYANLSKITLTISSTVVIALICGLCASLALLISYGTVKGEI